MAGVADKVFSLIEETVKEQNVSLWDVKFLKEGANWYLRVIIDSEDGITIDNCTDVHHAIDPILDEADPIDKSYYLEVCSPGLNRELSREEHFIKTAGETVTVKLYKSRDGIKEFKGVLEGFADGKITLNINEEQTVFDKQEVSKITLDDADF